MGDVRMSVEQIITETVSFNTTTSLNGPHRKSKTQNMSAA